MDENEEFEFRHRAEQEAAQKPAQSPRIALEETGNAKMLQGAKDLAGGLVRGAGSIGSTLLEMTPVGTVQRILNGKSFTDSRNERTQGIDAGLTDLVGSNPENTMYQAGKIGGEIAGTAGVGPAVGVVAKGAGVAPSIVNAITSGGFRTGRAASPALVGKLVNTGTRALGGAVGGGAAAGLVNPEDAKTGAIIGGAMPGAVQVSGLVGKGINALGKNTLGAMTGTSAETVKAAFDAGRKGSTEFAQHMRGNAEFDEVVNSAKEGLAKMREARGNQYRSGMVDISNDKSVLDFAPIDSAMKQVKSIGSFKGVQTNKNASGIVDELSATIDQWKALSPAEYHTPEGMDALKRAIGDIRDATQFGTPARKAADSVYNSVKKEIAAQAPSYAKVMKDYSEASQSLDEITKALSLGDKASKDTAIRKLQSLMRNNAQTNYGNRLSLANELGQQGGVSLTPAIAGQAMNTWTPRGMTGAIEKGALGIGSIMNPAILAAAPFASPRLVGEAAYATGRAISGTGKAANQLSNKLALLLGNKPNQSQGLLGGAMRVAPVIGLAGQLNQR